MGRAPAAHLVGYRRFTLSEIKLKNGDFGLPCATAHLCKPVKSGDWLKAFGLFWR